MGRGIAEYPECTDQSPTVKAIWLNMIMVLLLKKPGSQKCMIVSSFLKNTKRSRVKSDSKDIDTALGEI